MATETASRLQQAAQRYRDALEAQTTDAADAITAGWAKALERVDVEVDQLMAKMEAARLAGVEPSPAWLYQQRRLTALTDTIQAEVNRWAPLAEEHTRDLAYQAAADAQVHAQSLAREAASVGLPGLEAAFTSINPENMATILGHLAPGGPLRDLLVSLGGETAQAAADAVLQGVILGKGKDWMVKELQRSLDIPRWRAETIARTEALRAYRETSRESYKRSNVVGTWVWTAALDRRTCPACLALHSEEFSLEEQLDGHPRCRCAMVPRTLTWEELGVEGMPDTRPPIETGQEWLDAQTPLTQRAILGPGKADLYQAGKITLPDMVARTHSPAWGSMRRERSMKEIAEGRNANYRDLPQEPTPDLTPEAAVPETPTTPGRRTQKPLGKEPAGAKNMPEAQYVQAAKTLKDVDLETLWQAMRHKDRRVRWLAKREWLDRRELQDPPTNTLEARLPIRGNGETPPVDSAMWQDDLAAVNPRHSEGLEYQVNCTNTTTTWELRRRGFDVTAKPRPTKSGRPWGETADTWDADVAEWGEDLTFLQAEKALLAMGNGARGAVSVRWNAGGAHIFNWEVVDGRLEWADGQVNKAGSDLMAYLKPKVHGKIQVFRMDQLPLSDLLEDFVTW